MRKILFVFFILLVITASGSRAEDGDGLALMKVEAGARPSGMGGAFASISGDPMTSAYNPAGVTTNETFTASFGHVEYWENIRFETGYFTMPLSQRYYLHGGIRFARVDNLQGRFISTIDPALITEFDAHDISAKAGLAYKISDKISAGFAAGWFFEKIDTWRGSSFNIDLGVLYNIDENISAGASVTNLGSSFKLTQSNQPSSRDITLPTTYRLGGSYRFQKYRGVLDMVVVDDEFHLHAGAEGELHELFSLRAGYMFNYDSKNFTAGASINHHNMTFDYAFVPYTNDLGTTHLFNITFRL
ncbi:MAG: PorV/PorQ family protein [candidate division Zixibacteria bacterium]|nr:PorV/PorQ family protein [candidate division Zixibacteria bacterium]